MKRDGRNKSFWQTLEGQNFSTDFTDLVFDTIIVGAGITGVTLAKKLQDSGVKCLLLDKENPGFGTTGGTTAHINNFYDASYDEIIANFGEQAARLLVNSTKDTLDHIKKNVLRYHINCDFEECDFFLFSAEESQNEQLDRILAAHQQLGLKTLPSNTLPFSLPFVKAIRIEGQAQFHPLKYLLGLLDAFGKNGGAILTNQSIVAYENKEGEITLKTSDERIFTAKNIVWATHIPPGRNRFDLLVAPYRSYALTLKLQHAPEMLAQTADLYDPYHYFRYHRTGDGYYLIAGGFDHRTGDERDTEKHFYDLKELVNKNFEYQEVTAQWSSQYYVSADGLPYIGRMPNEPNVYIATGYGGNGMTFGSMASLIIPDLLLNKETALAKLLSPARIKPIASAKSVLSEGWSASQHFIMDKLSADKIDAFENIPLEEGRIVKYEGKTFAVYRDEQAVLHCLSSVCPHMGCTVNWNPSEKSWDCPCHGSRFDIEGKLLNGPATSGLQEMDR
ncbi:hypothetical protein BWD42_03510 [Sphingobacterium sp. CZ-UAM]|uniref:FAD-dependent oxidoreductase n=1 Tax=Sphingobacterium sp. CZ-UAM TaxID=1933868 RepID=UPI000987264E|nr:FAD-dependent oxidoreductase [Sphingobacterium sp. CZ-UAM]OOG19032.1 hypothetical protein BWD42_03510 [Sphingobacterium sp. CZ-UAM]